MPSSSKALSDLTGTRVVVTGATNGIGMATARAVQAALGEDGRDDAADVSGGDGD